MAKRATRSAKSESVVTLYPADAEWHPLGEDGGRDQSYVRKVRPQSDGQRRLMEAVREHNLSLAWGPAGTGKTYLAISAAVEAFDSARAAGEAAPEDWRAWFALGFAYDAARDRSRARSALRPAAPLRRS